MGLKTPSHSCTEPSSTGLTGEFYVAAVFSLFHE